LSEFAFEVQTLRAQLLRFARVQLRNDDWAEDAVSETVVAALEAPQHFGGRSQLKTWLIGILKHKLIDQLRRHAREVSVCSDDDAADLDPTLFSHGGHWREAPPSWGDPQHALRERQFFVVLEACIERLPPAQGRVFMMRVWLELETDEICQHLAISASHLGVLLHRARLRLRQCLQQSWFDPRG
jgi:RNA polymerase sigma-70 factor (ECF subfamily)